MSTIDADDLQATGYFLPEDSQLRLKQLCEYVGFLTNLARPRRPDEDREWYSEIRVGGLAICMELLGEQLAQVLDELSWPAERRDRPAASGAAAQAEACTEAAEPDAAEPMMDEADSRFRFGVTLDQLDESNLLLSSLRAIGNAVTCSDHAELSDVTLSIMGDAIVRDTEKLRDIIRNVNAQGLKSPHDTKPGVREEWTAYLALPERSPLGNVSYIVRQHPTYQ
jgi:hypothetical protein